MKLLHFTTGALSIAGGLILLLLALSMVLGSSETKEESDPLSEEDVMSMAIYPMAIPLLLNPVGIVTLTVFSAESQGLLQIGALIILVLIVAAIDLRSVLISSPSLQKRFEPNASWSLKNSSAYFWPH